MLRPSIISSSTFNAKSFPDTLTLVTYILRDSQYRFKIVVWLYVLVYNKVKKYNTHRAFCSFHKKSKIESTEQRRFLSFEPCGFTHLSNRAVSINSRARGRANRKQNSKRKKIEYMNKRTRSRERWKETTS